MRIRARGSYLPHATSRTRGTRKGSERRQGGTHLKTSSTACHSVATIQKYAPSSRSLRLPLGWRTSAALHTLHTKAVPPRLPVLPHACRFYRSFTSATCVGNGLPCSTLCFETLPSALCVIWLTAPFQRDPCVLHHSSTCRQSSDAAKQRRLKVPLHNGHPFARIHQDHLAVSTFRRAVVQGNVHGTVQFPGNGSLEYSQVAAASCEGRNDRPP